MKKMDASLPYTNKITVAGDVETCLILPLL